MEYLSKSQNDTIKIAKLYAKTFTARMPASMEFVALKET